MPEQSETPPYVAYLRGLGWKIEAVQGFADWHVEFPSWESPLYFTDANLLKLAVELGYVQKENA